MLTDTEMQLTAQQELEWGERLLWFGRPDPVRVLIEALVVWVFAVPWTAFAVFWLLGAAGIGTGKNLPQPGWTMDFLLPLFGVPFVLFGLAMMSAPYLAYLEAKRTVYAVTDRRVLIIETGKSRKVQSHSGGDNGKIKRKERADGTGDLIFAQEIQEDSEGSQSILDIKFVGIPEVRSVELLVRETLKQK